MNVRMADLAARKDSGLDRIQTLFCTFSRPAFNVVTGRLQLETICLGVRSCLLSFNFKLYLLLIRSLLLEAPLKAEMCIVTGDAIRTCYYVMLFSYNLALNCLMFLATS